MRDRVRFAGLGLLVGLAACGERVPAPELALAPEVTPVLLERKLARFAPVTIGFDASLLSEEDRRVLEPLLGAAQLMDSIFRRQVAPENPEWWLELSEADWPGADDARAYFRIMFGPWDRLKADRPFLNVGPKPEGAGFYPQDLTREELEAWVEAHPESRAAFTGYFTLIERRGRSLRAVPYSEAYRPWLERAAARLREAAALTTNPSLRRYLETRAAAFESNDYYESDVAWMDLRDNVIEPTIGPYEVYEDRLFGYKAAFEAFVTVKDPAASAALAALADRLPELDANLPMPAALRGRARGGESPIAVVDEIFAAGDTKAGVQTLGFNLPNDERVRAAKGSKKVMLRNVSRAKFETVLAAIADSVMTPTDRAALAFDPFFTLILMHELAHGLGPGFIRLRDGTETEVSKALRDLYPTLEEAKADVVGLWALAYLGRRGVYTPAFVRAAYLSHLPNIVRAVRFGATEAHGRANMIQFNFLLEQGALRFDPEALRFRVDYARMTRAVEALARELLTVQGEGSYERALSFLGQYGDTPRDLTAVTARLVGIPVDIRPQFVLEGLGPRVATRPRM